MTLAGAVALVLLWGWNAGDTAFDTAVWPVTHLMLREVLSQRSIVIPWLVIAIYAGELVWKHREVGTAEIADAAPVPTGIALLGRFLALVAIVVVFHAAFMAGGILLQTLQGYHNFELGLYVRVLFGLHLIDHVILAALAMTIHVLVNQKYVGHIAVLAACLLGLIARPMELPYLAVFNSGPPLDVLGHERLRPVPPSVPVVQALLGGVGAAARRGRGGRGHGRRPDRRLLRRAAPELDGERATLLPLRDRRAGPVRRLGVLGEVRGARGPVERRRAADPPSPGAPVQRRPDDRGHEGVARLLHEGFRALPVPPAAGRRGPALFDQRPRHGDDDRLRGAWTAT